MQEVWTYQIKVQGLVDEQELNKLSPLEISAVREDPACTLIKTHSDQSGLVGLIRHLHGRGFVFLAVTREP